MAERKAQDELHGRHAVEEIIEASLLPSGPLTPFLLSLRWGALGRAAANDDAGSPVSRRTNHIFMLALQRRVWDLKHTNTPMAMWSWRCGSVDDMPMNRSFPACCNSSTASRAPCSSSACLDGDPWNCTTSRYSVCIRLRLCSMPARILSRV